MASEDSFLGDYGMTYQGNIHGTSIPANIQAQILQNQANLANMHKAVAAHQIPVHHPAYASNFSSQQQFAHNAYRGVVPQVGGMPQMASVNYDKNPLAQQHWYNFALLDKLSSSARLRALAKLIDPDIELEDDAVEFIDDLLATWVDDVAYMSSQIAFARAKGDKAFSGSDTASRSLYEATNTPPMVEVQDISTYLQEAYPFLTLPSQKFSTIQKPDAPPAQFELTIETSSSSSGAVQRESYSDKLGSIPKSIESALIADGLGGDFDGDRRLTKKTRPRPRRGTGAKTREDSTSTRGRRGMPARK